MGTFGVLSRAIVQLLVTVALSSSVACFTETDESPDSPSGDEQVTADSTDPSDTDPSDTDPSDTDPSAPGEEDICGDGNVGSLEVCELGETKACAELQPGSSGTAQCNATCDGYDLSSCTTRCLPDASPIPDDVLNSSEGMQITTTGRSDQWACGAGPDVSYSFTSPRAGYYRFTLSSLTPEVAVILSVADQNCDTLYCADASSAASEDSFTIYLDEDEEIFIIADGATSADGGDFKLQIEREVFCGDGYVDGAEVCDSMAIDCAELNPGTVGTATCDATCTGYDTATCEYSCHPGLEEFPPEATTVSGTTTGRDNDADCSLSGGSGPDLGFVFTAPATGTYTFDTNGSQFDTMLVLKSIECTEVACDDDSGLGLHSSVVLSMQMNEQIIVIVDGYGSSNSGDYQLNITKEPECGDGIVEVGEECDDGNTDNQDGCLNTCISASCGDGYVHLNTETCDDGNDSNYDDCRNDCTEPACGDGFVQPGEDCDDGNESDDGNGCSGNVPTRWFLWRRNLSQLF